MKKVVLMLFVFGCISASVNATIRRVGYFGPPIAGQDFTSFGAAYNAASAGDTILVFPGVTGIDQTINKKLIILSVGDYLDPNSTPPGNASMQAFTGVATISNINFATGSDGSTISGFSGGNYAVEASNITISRNRSLNVNLVFTTATYSNLTISDNFWVAVFANGAGSIISNLTVSNNLMYSFSTPPVNTYSGNISNNVWAYDNTMSGGNANGGSTTMSNIGAIELGGGSYLFQNNILVSYTSSNANNNSNVFMFANGGNTVFNYNLALECGKPQNFGAGTGNVITPIANVSAIFAAFPAIGSSSPDARYKLGASSPAATIGSGSKPIGMYGGNTPYKLSLIPAIPSIYKLSSPQGNNPSGSSITINVSTRGNN